MSAVANVSLLTGHRRTGSDTNASARNLVKPVITSVLIENADGSNSARTNSLDGFRLSLPSVSSDTGENRKCLLCLIEAKLSIALLLAATAGTDSAPLTAPLAGLEAPVDGSLVYLALDAQFQVRLISIQLILACKSLFIAASTVPWKH